MKPYVVLGSLLGILAFALLAEVSISPGRGDAIEHEEFFVLFDESHAFQMPSDYVSAGDGVQGAIEESAWYGCSHLAARLRGRGWVVEAENSGPLTEEMLRDVHVLMMMSPGGSGAAEGETGSNYSDKEIRAIVDFVREGGGLYVHGSAFFAHERDIHRLTDPFGVRFALGGQVLDDSNRFLEESVLVRSSGIAAHPAVQGTQRFYSYGSFVAQLGEAAAIAWTEPTAWFDRFVDPGNADEAHWTDYIGNEERDADERVGPLPVIAALEFGEGRVCFDSGLMLANQWASETGNFDLAISIVEWLARRG